jgi:1,4-dihydroxy-2-naphthoate octaprenyltransferase
MLIATICYTLSLIVLGALIGSYLIAYILDKSISILSLLLFLISIFLVVLVITSNYWLSYYGLKEITCLVMADFRSIILLVTSVFFLWTTWKNKTKK